MTGTSSGDRGEGMEGVAGTYWGGEGVG
jgi:hypothetical protein